MASYRKRQGKWQAQVRLAGKPAISKTFPTKELARAWAAQQALHFQKDTKCINK